MLYRASKRDCDALRLKAPMLSERRRRERCRARSTKARATWRAQIAQIVGRPHLATAAQEGRDAVRPPQTHPQARPAATTRTERRARRVPPRSHRPEPQEAGEADPATEPPARMNTDFQSTCSIYFDLPPTFSTKSIISDICPFLECPLFPDSDQTGDAVSPQDGVENGLQGVIEAPQLEPRIMRYELTDFEWTAIKPFQPNKPRGVPRVDDRRVLNGIFWVSSAP